jgi:hypothetical protein
MTAVLEFPTPEPMPPRRQADIHVRTPMVYVEAVWQYKHLTRPLQGPGLSDEELTLLGTDGWELVSVVADGQTAHFYFKRQSG